MVATASPGFIAIKAGDLPDGYETSAACPAPRFFAYWDATGFRRVLRDAGFTVERYELRRDRQWHKFLVRAGASAAA